MNWYSYDIADLLSKFQAPALRRSLLVRSCLSILNITVFSIVVLFVFLCLFRSMELSYGCPVVYSMPSFGRRMRCILIASCAGGQVLRCNFVDAVFVSMDFQPGNLADHGFVSTLSLSATSQVHEQSRHRRP